MSSVSAKLYLFVCSLLESEEGQDMVEYALVVALIAFGAVSGMSSVASGINNAFTGVASTLTSAA